MKKISLTVEKRILSGRKVKNLRKQNILPANLFGKKVTSVALQVPKETFMKVYHEAGETGLVELNFAGEVRPVLIQNVQIEPVNSSPLHVDFYQVDLKEKVKAHVPLDITGVAPAVEQKLGLLLELVNKVEVEALPADLPEKIMVDVSQLKELHSAIKAQDLKLASGVTLLTDEDTELVKVGELITKEAVELAAAEAAQKAAAVAAATPTSTEATTSTTAAPTKPETTTKTEKPA